MSATYGRPDVASARRTVARALDLGVTMFDTAEMYGRGGNERLIGAALGRRRHEVVLATKTGIRTLPGVGLPVGLDGRPERIRRSVDASLKRLGTDWIDLYYLHRVDPAVPIEDSVGAMAEAVAAGKVRHLGLSEATPAQIRGAHATHPLAAIQMEWSLFSRDVEDEVLATARELAIGIVAYSPLGRGMLTGAAGATTQLSLLDYRRLLPRWRRAHLAQNLRQVQILTEVAHEVGANPAQVALAWVLSRGRDVVPIPGTTRSAHLEANLAATTLSLSSGHLGRLEQIRASGPRYPEAVAQRTGVSTAGRAATPGRG
ncbi:MAG: aldo/keto reductase [Actinomyces sp.]|uniref:aldo/keto reductase n=1 Tax=Actinomyces sp. TaxID=29317 RepID=UPI0026DC09BF|nr:aldo/keto reductase [Actinomyces sp.]MDO4242516.1 aldo/keto reductase [Actinomyces sp.]